MSQQIITLLPMIIMLGLNAAIFGTIAVKMARKRGLRTVPAFFAGMFSSFVVLFYIAMHPITEKQKISME
ncbi:MAG TPA: hypothetical protein VEF53_16870 [Patescibacteria group bacterium]|nr:hypothetical protein [Patescibacteria group bacterium]